MAGENKFVATIGLQAEKGAESRLLGEISEYFRKNPVPVSLKLDAASASAMKAGAAGSRTSGSGGGGAGLFASEKQIADAKRSIENMMRSATVSGPNVKDLEFYFNYLTENAKIAKTDLTEIVKSVRDIGASAKGTAPALKEMLSGLSVDGKPVKDMQSMLKQIDRARTTLTRAQTRGMSSGTLRSLGVDGGDLEQYGARLESLKDKLLEINSGGVFKDMSREIVLAEAELEDMIKTVGKLDKELKAGSIADAGAVGKLRDNLVRTMRSNSLPLSANQSAQLQKYYQETASADGVTNAQLAEATEYINSLKAAATSTSPALKEMFASLNGGAGQVSSLSGMISQIDTLRSMLAQAQTMGAPTSLLGPLGTAGYTGAIAELNRVRDALLDINAVPVGQDVSADFQQISGTLNMVLPLIRTFNTELKNAEAADESKVSAKFSAWQNWLEKNTKAARAYRQEIDEINRAYENGQVGGMTNGQLADLNKRQTDVILKAGTEGNLGLTGFDRLMKGWEKFGGWTIVTRSMTMAIHTVQQLYRDVEQLDSQLAQLQIITGESKSAMDAFADSAADAARKVGASMTDITASATEWARLGYSMNEALSLAQQSKIFSNVAGLDVNSGTSYLISTMKAFDISAENVSQIVDAMTEVGNKFPISAAGIGEGMANAAAALQVAGNDLNQSIALITAGNVVNQNPSTVANALKTSTLRIRGAKTELEAMGEETDNLAESTAKLRDDIRALTGVDIMVDEDTFKSTYEMYRELAQVWNGGELSDTSKANLLEVLGGKRNANVIASILENFDTAEKAYETSLNSAGAAEEANAIYLDTISGKVAQLSATWQELSKNLLDDAGVKTAVDALSGILGFLNKIVDKAGSLPSLVTALAGGLSLFKDVGWPKTRGDKEYA